MVKRASSWFARLPIELVNMIFAMAAQSSRHTCLDICLVASWARQIALPHLFRTLVTKDRGVKFNKYLANLQYVPINTNINPPALVKNVWMPLQDQGATDSVIDVFENCHNIKHMALTIGCFFKLICATTSDYILGSVKKVTTRPARANDRDLHLTVLGANTFNWAFHGYWQADVSLRSPLFDRITHIRVETASGYQTRHKLYHFSRLSHLSVPYYNSIQHKAEELDEFLELRYLEMFVVAGVRRPLYQAHWKRLEAWVWAKRQRDKRVFFVEIPAIDIEAEWEAEMMGGESIWDKALRYTTQWEARESTKAALVRNFA
jgi:hypothetical protein